ncbi:YigZ family protein [Nocardioides flavescens]|uniref:DUF1949 domain-containing protein n=1 Tax=Nocardioides flavescens TaxID=2691959 RepID=A0A6L7F1W6_9ACTN|nr:DUF1949 domain-containing protein [Nocardioides flavescens]
MVTGSYLVPGRDAETELEVKRSRFLCTLVRADDEGAAREVLDRLRRAHHDARHHCSALRIGVPPAVVERAADDGEPAGTAGAPMLEVLRGREVSDVVVVVTRWFGGTLLGAGGLARAYAEAVRLGLDAAGTRTRRLLVEHLVRLDHATAGVFESALHGLDVVVLDREFGADVALRIATSPERTARLASLVAAVSSGRGQVETVGERWT